MFSQSQISLGSKAKIQIEFSHFALCQASSVTSLDVREKSVKIKKLAMNGFWGKITLRSNWKPKRPE